MEQFIEFATSDLVTLMVTAIFIAGAIGGAVVVSCLELSYAIRSAHRSIRRRQAVRRALNERNW